MSTLGSLSNVLGVISIALFSIYFIITLIEKKFKLATAAIVIALLTSVSMMSHNGAIIFISSTVALVVSILFVFIVLKPEQKKDTETNTASN